MRDYEGDGQGGGRIWYLYKVTWGGETSEGGTRSKGGGCAQKLDFDPGRGKPLRRRCAEVRATITNSGAAQSRLGLGDFLRAKIFSWRLYFKFRSLVVGWRTESSFCSTLPRSHYLVSVQCQARIKGVTRSPGPSPVRSKVKVETIWKPVASCCLWPQTLCQHKVDPSPPPPLRHGGISSGGPPHEISWSASECRPVFYLITPLYSWSAQWWRKGEGWSGRTDSWRKKLLIGK